MRKTSRRVKPALRPDRIVIAKYAALRAWPGVVSVGLGRKESKSKLTGQLCVKLYVQKKLRKRQLRHRPFPKTTILLIPVGKGLYKSRRVPTDVVEMPDVVFASTPDIFHQAVPSGAQVGLVSSVAGFGTSWGVVRQRDNQRVLLVTAGHVVSRSDGQIEPGHLVYQPQPPLHRPKFVIGRTLLGMVGNSVEAGGFLDVAFLEPANPDRSATNASWHPEVPAPKGVISLAQVVEQRVGMLKVGAKTLLTIGEFSAFHPAVEPQPGILFRNVLEFVDTSPAGTLGDKGDSGSMVLSRAPAASGHVIGLLFATSSDKRRIFVIPWERVQSQFKVDLV